MESVTTEMGLEEACGALLSRIDQITRSEVDTLQAHKTQIYNLQRKLKAMKEMLDSKDLHMDLLRKKVQSLEDRLATKTDIEREKDVEQSKNKKLSKLLDKYKDELDEAHAEIKDLRNRLAHMNDLQSRIDEKDRIIASLDEKIAHLEEVRMKQANRIAEMEGNFQNNTQKMIKHKDVASNTIQSLTSELRTTKIAYDDVLKREQQLLDLRHVIARMLGLHIDSLAVPDYEIVTRLEKLVLANQANATTAFVLDSAIADMGEGFRAGYEAAGATHDTLQSRISRQMRATSPARGLGQSRKMDSKVY